MAPLPSNSTDRWFLDYITGSQPTAAEHTMMIRGDANLGLDGATGTFLAVLNGVGAAGFWTGWRPIRLRHSVAGSNFSMPVSMGSTLGAFVGTGSGSGYIESCEAVEATIQGRSPTTGRRGDFSLYGIRAALGTATFRKTSSDGAPWSALISACQGLAVPLRAVDGSQLSIYPYVNLNYNSYWESRLRTK